MVRKNLQLASSNPKAFLSWFVLKERERKEKNLNSHSCNDYLQLRDIYIQG